MSVLADCMTEGYKIVVDRRAVKWLEAKKVLILGSALLWVFTIVRCLSAFHGGVVYRLSMSMTFDCQLQLRLTRT